MSANPIRLPDAATVETVLAGLDPASADANLAPALANAFPGFSFTTAGVDDFYWRDASTVLSPDGARRGDHRAWLERELAELGGDLTAFWTRHRASGFRFSEWRGTSVFAFAPTGPGVADFVQIALGRESEFLAGPVVDPDYRPTGVDALFEPSWVRREPVTGAPTLAGPAYRLRGRAGGIVHMKRFLARRAGSERERREARRPELETRVIREVGPDDEPETPFLNVNPGRFEFVPRENRFFADWERSSTSVNRIFEHWTFDIHDVEGDGQQREIGFIPRPLKMPTERLLLEENFSTHRLMQRIEAVDAAVGLRFAWFFLMTHGYWVDPDIGDAIADALRAGRVRLPNQDAAVLLGWADNKYLF